MSTYVKESFGLLAEKDGFFFFVYKCSSVYILSDIVLRQFQLPEY